jgi:outer membrane protein TolC
MSPGTRALLAAVGALCTALPAARAQTSAGVTRLSTDQAVALALARNEHVDVAVAGVDQAHGAVVEARSRFLPKLDFSYGYTRNVQRPVIYFDQGGVTQQIAIGRANDNVFGLSLTQTLFDGSVGVAQRAAALGRDLAEENLETTKRGVVLATRTMYYQVLLDSVLVAVQQAALAQTDARLHVVEERARAGLASEYDRLTAQVAVENLRPPLIRARNQLALDQNTLKRTIGLPLGQPIVLTDTLSFEPVAPADSETVRAAAVGRSDVVAMQKMVGLSDAAIAAERWTMFPNLTLTATLLRHASSAQFLARTADFSQSMIVGVQIGWPLFDGRASQGRLLQDRAGLRANEAQLAGKEADVHLEIQQAQQTLEAAADAVAASRGTAAVAQQALAIAQQRFLNGLAIQVELGDAELAVTQARTNFAQALYAFNVARARWQAALGKY